MREPKGGRTISNAKADPPPPGGYKDLCGICRRPIEPDGRCADCGGWPFTVWTVDRATGAQILDPFMRRPGWSAPMPRRACPACGVLVRDSGCCDPCGAQVLPSLVHPELSRVAGCWVEADGEGQFPIQFLSPAQAKARLREIIAHFGSRPSAPVDLEQARKRFWALERAERQISAGMDRHVAMPITGVRGSLDCPCDAPGAPTVDERKPT